MSVAYEVRRLSCRLGGHEVLHQVSLDIRRGKVLALVGPNGAGKSTLLGVLSGDIPLHAGSAALFGQPINQWSPKALAQHRSVLLQHNEVSFAFTVRDVIEMGRSPWWNKGSAERDHKIVADAVRATDTEHLLDRTFITLSGGEKARVSLARVLAQSTEVVLLDEPTAALDLRHQEEVMSLARELAKSGRTVVVVVHDLSLAAAYADEIALIDGGRLAAHGTPEDVITAAQVKETYGIDVSVHTNPDDGCLVVVPRRSRRESEQPEPIIL